MTWGGLSPPYGTIVADPPWRYDRSGVQGAVSDQYSTLTLDEIAALPVAELAAPDAHLYLWTTNPKMFESPTAAEIAAAWGFTYKTTLTWVKGEKVGIGWYYRVDTEHCVFAVRGSAPIPGELRESNVLWSPRGAHSAKPDAFADRIERVSPGPYVELFCRRPRFGWDSWGKGYEIGSPNAGSPSASIGSDNRSGPGECVNTPRSVADTALGGAHVQDRSAFAAGDQVSPPEDRAS